jgi:hypothetical protein
LGERLHGMQEVVSSTLIGSITFRNYTLSIGRRRDSRHRRRPSERKCKATRHRHQTKPNKDDAPVRMIPVTVRAATVPRMTDPGPATQQTRRAIQRCPFAQRDIIKGKREKGKGLFGKSKATRHRHQTKPENAEALDRMKPVTARAATVPGTNDPGPATQQTRRAGGRTLWVFGGRFRIIILAKPVVAPFPNIAGHVQDSLRRGTASIRAYRRRTSDLALVVVHS